MDLRTVGFVLIWLGAVLLVAVLVHRVRRGAWGPDAFDETPPLARWPQAVSIAGVVAALTGAALMAWSLR